MGGNQSDATGSGHRARRKSLVEPFDSEVGSARVDRGEREASPSRAARRQVRAGGHPERAVEQGRPQPLEQMVGTAGPGPGEPGDEHGSSGMDAGSMDAP